ncbi:MAG TPA: hypothetical protein VJX67_04125 [Blastocatellia bacterium]|nr:hypothetical protein [Blastocatellia bacterium]
MTQYPIVAEPAIPHRHTFELIRFAGKPASGVRKDVIVVPAMKQVEVDFTADNPRPTLSIVTSNCIWITVP